jgi:type IV pilus assembly protein PilV
MPASRRGFSLVETLIALLIVSLAAMLMVRSSAANAIALAHSMKRVSAVRLASEFSAWVYRDGPVALGMPLDDAMAEANAQAIDCHEGHCTAEQGAWHYLSRWRERLLLEIPDARVLICVDDAPSVSGAGWSCHPDGATWVMKLGWPPRSDDGPVITLELGTTG